MTGWQGRASTIGRAWKGIVSITVEGRRRPVEHVCPHSHRARAAAEKCAADAAARLNRADHDPAEPLP